MSRRSNSKKQAPQQQSSSVKDEPTSNETEQSLGTMVPWPLQSFLPKSLSNMTMSSVQNDLITSGMLIDPILRSVTRYLLRQRAAECHALDIESLTAYKHRFVSDLKQRAIAEQTSEANSQHYEVPSSFYTSVLGARLKYSCCYYQRGNESLTEGENAMLALYVKRAKLTDNQIVLDLGCGWGSFTLYAAPLFPNSTFLAVSNSSTQREFIMRTAAERNLTNVQVLTADINNLHIDQLLPLLPARLKQAATAAVQSKQGIFDRIISIEMFEHMKNYSMLLALCSNMLKVHGHLFVHIFVHREFPYHFETNNSWMAKYFFSGGTMPSVDLLPSFLQHPVNLQLDQQWSVNGTHYARTSRQWLDLLDKQWNKVEHDLRQTITQDKNHVRSQLDNGMTPIQFMRMWRVFFIAVEEMFAYNKGEEWFVQHYLFTKPSRDA
jgi:cyclopropane-fatty-acyl-phospholipid synthase